MHYMLFIECSVTEQSRVGGRKGMGVVLLTTGITRYCANQKILDR